jgi:hypothetical protein
MIGFITGQNEKEETTQNEKEETTALACVYIPSCL